MHETLFYKVLIASKKYQYAGPNGLLSICFSDQFKYLFNLELFNAIQYIKTGESEHYTDSKLQNRTDLSWESAPWQTGSGT